MCCAAHCCTFTLPAKLSGSTFPRLPSCGSRGLRHRTWHLPAVRPQSAAKYISFLERRKAEQVEGDAEGAEERRAELRNGRVSELRLSFRNLVHVDNLQGLISLRTLHLDNNALTRLENLDHLVR